MTEKTCFKCRRALPMECFYRHPQMGDGLLGKCRECTRRDVRDNRNKNLAESRRRELEWRSAKRSANREVVLERSRDKNRRKKRSTPGYAAAHVAVARAVRRGDIVRPESCRRCGSTGRISAHHDDYLRPLDVMWLCPVCHAARHRELGRLRTIEKLYGPDPPLGF